MIARVWWSRTGAEQGRPWRVQYADGKDELVRSVTITGTVKTLTHEGGFMLPDGPRGVLEVIGGDIDVIE